MLPRESVHLRDRIARAICNWTLNHVATSWYRNMVGGSIRYGLRSAARDTVKLPAVDHLDCTLKAPCGPDCPRWALPSPSYANPDSRLGI